MHSTTSIKMDGRVFLRHNHRQVDSASVRVQTIRCKSASRRKVTFDVHEHPRCITESLQYKICDSGSKKDIQLI